MNKQIEVLEKTMKIQVVTPEVTEVEIELPFYGKNKIENPTEFVKVDENKMAAKIRFYGGEPASYMKVYAEHLSHPGINDFYPCEKQEFDFAFADFVESISNI